MSLCFCAVEIDSFLFSSSPENCLLYSKIMTESKNATPYDELQVPGEPGVWYCARHTQTTTRLRCGRCEKPICPKCTNMGPVGARCRDCLSNKGSHIYQVGPAQFALAFGAAVVMGAVGAFGVGMLGGWALFALFYAPALGPIVGKFVTRITKGKRGPLLAAATGVGIAVGALGLGAITGAIFSPFLWLMIVIAVIGVWLFLR